MKRLCSFPYWYYVVFITKTSYCTVLEEKYYLEDLGTDERIILKWILKNPDEVWTGFIWFRIGTSSSVGKFLTK
jgi:hypothetical protein